jgi:hypothetical protein
MTEIYDKVIEKSSHLAAMLRHKKTAPERRGL